MPTMDDVQERIQRYFRARAKRLLAAAEEAVTGHGTTTGNQREDEVRRFLREVLPERFRVDHGIVFGAQGKSRESDVVVWEAHDFPRIPQGDAKIMFAESVRTIVEVKSDWSSEARDDIWGKSEATHTMRRGRSTTLEGRVKQLEDGFSSLYEMTGHSSPYASKGRSEFRNKQTGLAFSAIVLRGGQTLVPPKLGSALMHRASTELPDLMLFLDAGRVFKKLYDAHPYLGGYTVGGLEIYEAGEDALLVFTSLLLQDITDQAEYLAHPFRLDSYCVDVLLDIPRKRFVHAPLQRETGEAHFEEEHRRAVEVVVVSRGTGEEGSQDGEEGAEEPEDEGAETG